MNGIFLSWVYPQEGWLTMGCTPKSWPILEGRVTNLFLVGGTTTGDYLTTRVCLLMDVTPLTTDTTWARGFPPMVEDTGEPKEDPWFWTVVTGLKGWTGLGIIDPWYGDVKLGVIWDIESGWYLVWVDSKRRSKRADTGSQRGRGKIVMFARCS